MASTDLDELRRLRRARDFIDREYARPLDVPAMAKAAHMSTAHFSRRFREAYGETPYAHLMTRRIERAKALLRRGDVRVTDACTAVGATSLGSFSSRFTEIVGESPSAYRARDHRESVVIPSCTSQIWGRPRRVHERAEKGGRLAAVPVVEASSSFREVNVGGRS
ncbi:helix-turn-helix domain-containing protein [Pseudoclavibacter sp. JSM 162008]|uniref:helix-turn-helix domain-containing protein n=1 Tax=Pseudoclavibacter sp. JSM 162008 TaxID=3229855 RepID=UPI00352524C0